MSTYVYVDGEADAFRGGGIGRKPVQRRTVDYTATTVRHLEVREEPVRDQTTTRARSIPNARLGPSARGFETVAFARPPRRRAAGASRAKGPSFATTAPLSQDPSD